MEPSAVMRAQRPAGAARCVAAAAAERLPFEDQSFDAAMAFSTVHHWQDPVAGLREMRRLLRGLLAQARGLPGRSRAPRGVAMWTRLGPESEQRAVRDLRDDLDSGRWAERNSELVDLDAAELGLCLLVV